MKKILSLLTAITLTTSGTSSVISCNKKTTKFDVFNLNTWGNTQKNKISSVFKNWITNNFLTEDIYNNSSMDPSNKPIQHTWGSFLSSYHIPDTPGKYYEYYEWFPINLDQLFSIKQIRADFEDYSCIYSNKNQQVMNKSNLIKKTIQDGIWMTIISSKTSKIYSGECWVWIQGSV